MQSWELVDEYQVKINCVYLELDKIQSKIENDLKRPALDEYDKQKLKGMELAVSDSCIKLQNALSKNKITDADTRCFPNVDKIKRLYPGKEVIFWWELFKHLKSMKIPTVEMLKGNGDIYLMHSRIDGDTLKSEKKERVVIFDREYVVTKLALDNRFLLALSLERWLELMTEVYSMKKKEYQK
jgi:hypothetical protein